MRIDLNGEWTLHYAESGKGCIFPGDLEHSAMDHVVATVPGNVELDLVRAGVLPANLFSGENILQVRRYEGYEWWYVKEFEWPSAQALAGTRLHLAGVDCWAEYWLNGTLLGSSANMLIEHEWDVSAVARPGPNVIAIHLRPARELGWSKPSAPYWSGLSPLMEESVWVRKAPHGYGWDIMPRAVSAGLWRDVWIDQQRSQEIERLYIATREATEARAVVDVSYRLRLPIQTLTDDCELRISMECGDSKVTHRQKVYFPNGICVLSIDRPQLWWPYGYGAANLYTVVAELWVDGTQVSSRREEIGIRTVRLERRDATESSDGVFQFIVNQVPVFARGTNWGPIDAFHSRDRAGYSARLQLLKELQGTMVRLWGGNVYPDDELYRFCDREGIMVWQDFSMACALYPQNPEFQAAIQREVRAVVRRYANHPSLVVWCGDNEVDQTARGRHIPTTSNVLTRQTIPAVLSVEDPYRPYLPSSPFISQAVDKEDRLEAMPEEHLWGPRNYFKSEFYTDYQAKFVSEIGFMGLPSERTLRRFLDDDHVWPPNNRQWLVHATDPTMNPGSYYWERTRKTFDRAEEYFGSLPSALSDIVLASQIVQAEGFKFAIEWARQRTDKTGLLWWSLFDGWPQVSDAIVDYYLDKKLAFHYVQRSQAPLVILVGEAVGQEHPVIVSNHRRQSWQGSIMIRDEETQETVWEGEAHVAAGQMEVATRICLASAEPRLLILHWEVDGEPHQNHYVVGTPPFSYARYCRWLTILLGNQIVGQNTAMPEHG